MTVLSIPFLLFVTVVFIFNWVTSGKTRKIILLISNGIFLFSLGPIFSWIYVIFLVCYVCIINRIFLMNKSTISLVLKTAPIILGLCIFKYAGLFQFTSIIMPIGISFYTFKTISYIIEVHNCRLESQTILDTALYILYFPVFSAGPINRPACFFKQLNLPKKFDYNIQKNGAVLAALGLFQKLVFANYYAIIVNSIFSNEELTGWYLILGIILYALQLYIDFDAYSNISIGISRMLGFEIEQNFKQPYLALSIKDFWSRWHISLSSWLKDYIYIPLGGSRKGRIRKYLNILVIFIISGMWHGSTLVFVVWGIGHALVNILEDLFFPKEENRIPKLIKPLLILINFIIVSLLWVFFRSSSFEEAIRIISNMFVLGQFNFEIIDLNTRQVIWMIIILLIVVITDILRNKTDMIKWLSERNAFIRWGVYMILVFIAIIFGVYGPGYNPSDFIYVTF